jgi:hypothetical protein
MKAFVRNNARTAGTSIQTLEFANLAGPAKTSSISALEDAQILTAMIPTVVHAVMCALSQLAGMVSASAVLLVKTRGHH